MTNTIRYGAWTYGSAVQNTDGTWTPPSPIAEQAGEWGTLRIEVGAVWDCHGAAYAAAGSVAVKVSDGYDVTTVNDVPVLIESLGFAEPFGETVGALSVPRVTPWDDPAAVGIEAGANVDIWRVLPDALATAAGTAEVPYWHGIVASLEHADGAGISSGLSVQLVGALYGEASVRAHQPFMLDEANDVGTWLGRSLSPKAYARPLPPFERFSFESTTTGIEVRYRGSRGQSVIDYLDELLAQAKDADGTWTISRAFTTYGTLGAFPRPRHYYLREKDTDFTGTIQTNSVQSGGWGIAYSLSTDATQTPTAIYGEGVHPTDSTDLSGSRWRNAVYPMLGGTAPSYPDHYPLALGSADSGYTADVITQVQSQLRAGGWPDARITGTWDADTSTAINALYEAAGTAQTSSITGNSQWNLVFGTGSGYTDLGSGFFLPLHDENPFYTYAADGDVIGTASGYDRTALRVDQTIAYGDGISKSRARKNARRIISTTGPDTVGTITLTSDGINEAAVARSRMDIREGSWIRVVGRAGATDFYIAGVSISPESDGLPVTLTVSTSPDDLLALATRIERNRAANSDPARSFYSQRTQTVRPFRSAVGWDAESGAGLIRDFSAAGSAWTCQTIVGAQYGSIQSLRVTALDQVGYCFAVFGGSVAGTALDALIPTPLGTVTDDYPSWWQHPGNLSQLTTWGHVESWGSNGEAAGYYPGAQSIGGTVAGTATGVLEDAGSWTFASLDPPFLTIAVWPDAAGTVTFRGQMRIAVDEG